MRGSQKNKNYKIKLTPEFAYAIGLLTTDGNLSKDGRHLEFTSNDIQLVKTFKKCMNLIDVEIGTKTSGSTDKRYPRIQFSNVKLYKWLLKIGLMPNKSKAISKLEIPNKYFFDFLRGCFDGDGTIYSFWDSRWHSSFMFYIAFSSASLNFLKWLQEKIKNLCRLNGSIGSAGNNTYLLRYAKEESVILFNKMFYSDNIPFLQRKYEKARKIFQININYNEQSQFAQVEKLENSLP
ncbi:LAGLIDADG family homing endonuclease [Patescibacteria group bacterium]|nr:LAGLIDADG family homing endonuclease [Patescibacteria group bacterium]